MNACTVIQQPLGDYDEDSILDVSFGKDSDYQVSVFPNPVSHEIISVKFVTQYIIY